MSEDTASYGTAPTAGLSNGQEIIAKTGTTNTAQSAFFIGAIPSQALAVALFTNEQGKGTETLDNLGGILQDGGDGGTWPAAIWHTYAEDEFVPLGVEQFTTPVFTGSAWNQVPPGLRKVAKKHQRQGAPRPERLSSSASRARAAATPSASSGQAAVTRTAPERQPERQRPEAVTPSVVTCRAEERRRLESAPAASGDRARPRARLDMGVDAPGSTNTRFDGGAERSGPHGPGTLAVALGSTSVLLAASVLGMVLAFAEKSPCRSGAWNSYAKQFQDACYTDIYPLYYNEGCPRGRCPTPATRSNTRC